MTLHWFDRPETKNRCAVGVKDNGVFVNGEKSYENRNYSKAGC